MKTILLDILKSLKNLKNIGIIHCDIKPENICFLKNNKNHVKIIDYGSSMFIKDNFEHSEI